MLTLGQTQVPIGVDVRRGCVRCRVSVLYSSHESNGPHLSRTLSFTPENTVHALNTLCTGDVLHKERSDHFSLLKDISVMNRHQKNAIGPT